MGSVGDIRLVLYGTKELPEHMRYGPRTYNHNYNRVHNRLNVLRNGDYDLSNDINEQNYDQGQLEQDPAFDNLDFLNNEYWDTNFYYNDAF